jgi:hypothetical protein
MKCVLPLIKSIQDATLIFSLDFIIFNASSSSTSPVNVSSMTSITRSCKGNRRLEASLVMAIRPLNASSITIHPRNAYEILSFQKDRYPYPSTLALPSSPVMHETNLLILQPHEQHFLHKCQLWLLVPLSTLTDISRIKSDLVSILGVLIGGFGRAIGILSSWCWRGDSTALVFVAGGALGCSPTASQARCGGGRGHVRRAGGSGQLLKLVIVCRCCAEVVVEVACS